MGTSADFNYKVALASGLKSLQSGRVRQAEEQFRYLVTHFPAADGGYRGLARVLIEQEDRPRALRTLIDGGAALARVGQRTGAIGLYRDAVTLDPHDLRAHRRLAAALGLAGDNDAAAHEYHRFIQTALEAGDEERASLEAAYALERLPQSGEVGALARDIRVSPARGTPTPPPPPSDDLWSSPSSTRPAADERQWPLARPAPEATPDPRAALLAAFRGGENGGPVGAAAAPSVTSRDPHAADGTLETARQYLAEGRIDAASDLLLQLIATGDAEHDAQRLLVDVARGLGRSDVATAKCRLLVQALRLDGRNDLAAEVEQLALAD